jgi:hypothetical protein
LVVTAALLPSEAFFVLELVVALPAGLRAPAGVARALPVPLFLVADPTRFVVTLEAREPAAFLRTGALEVFARTGDLPTTFRGPTGAERALRAAFFFAADPTLFVVAFEARALAIFARRPGPEATWAFGLPATLLAPVLVGLPAAALEPLPEAVRRAGLRGSSSDGVFAIWSPQLLEVAVQPAL